MQILIKNNVEVCNNLTLSKYHKSLPCIFRFSFLCVSLLLYLYKDWKSDTEALILQPSNHKAKICTKVSVYSCRQGVHFLLKAI